MSLLGMSSFMISTEILDSIIAAISKSFLYSIGLQFSLLFSRFIMLSYTSFQVSSVLFKFVKWRQCCNDKHLERSCVPLFVCLMRFLSLIKFSVSSHKSSLIALPQIFLNMFLTGAGLTLFVELKMLKLQLKNSQQVSLICDNCFKTVDSLSFLLLFPILYWARSFEQLFQSYAVQFKKFIKFSSFFTSSVRKSHILSNDMSKKINSD